MREAAEPTPRAPTTTPMGEAAEPVPITNTSTDEHSSTTNNVPPGISVLAICFIACCAVLAAEGATSTPRAFAMTPGPQRPPGQKGHGQPLLASLVETVPKDEKDDAAAEVADMRTEIATPLAHDHVRDVGSAPPEGLARYGPDELAYDLLDDKGFSADHVFD